MLWPYTRVSIRLRHLDVNYNLKVRAIFFGPVIARVLRPTPVSLGSPCRSHPVTRGRARPKRQALVSREIVHLVLTEEAELAKLQCSKEKPDKHPKECAFDA